MIRTDVAIVGGGLVGLWAAYFLRQRGASVIVLESGRVGAQASGVNFGSLRLQGRFLGQLPLALRAQEHWRATEALFEQSIELNFTGHTMVALDAAQLEKIERYAIDAAAYGLELEMLGPNAIAQRWPYLSGTVMGASFSRACGVANPRLAGPATARMAIRAGAQIQEQSRVSAIEAGEPFVLALENGTRVQADALINAAGAWGGEIAASFGEPVPLFAAGPADMVSEPVPHFIKTTFQAVDGSIVVRQIDRGNLIIAGHPRGPVDFERARGRVPPDKIALNIARLAALIPALASVRLIRSWTGIEGYLPDMLPVISASRTTGGLFHGFGLSGHGFQIAPAVGEALADLVLDGASRTPIAPFDIARFADGHHDTAKDMNHEFDSSILKKAGVQ